MEWKRQWNVWISTKPSRPGVWRRKEGGFLVRARPVDPKTRKKREIIKVLPDTVTPMEAEQWLLAEIGKVKRGEERTGVLTMPRFRDYAVLTVERKHLDGRILSAKTIQSMASMFKTHLFPAFGDVFVDKIKGGAIPREFIKPAKEGIEKGLTNGILAGYLVSDLIVTLIDGKYHDVDSDEMSFQLAGKYAIQEALRKAGSIFMEPIMKLEVTVPEDYWGNVTGDLMKRRAQIKESGNRGKLKTALVDSPLSEMFGYANALRSLTQGRASFSMEPSFYKQVPANLAEKIIGHRKDEGGGNGPVAKLK